ncbi:MAG: PEGA domain-containing protein [Lachnospiraceae bacterium]|nr:PEGA domain-containing protein [Lachnospiraceae bacterium]
MERKGKAPRNSQGAAETGKYEEREGVKLELSTVGMEKNVPEVKKDIPVMARFLSDELTDKDYKKMEREHKKRRPLPGILKVILGITAIAVISLAAFLAYGYVNSQKTAEDVSDAEDIDNKENIVAENEMKAEGTVTILGIDKGKGEIRFIEPESGDEYVLNTSGSTVYEDSYGNPMVVDQLMPGDIVDIVVSVHSSALSSVKKNADTFEFPGITDYDISVNKKIFSYDDRNYKLLKGTILLSGGEQTAFKNLKDGDVLTVRGIGNDVYTIMQTGGNGYVRIRGAESFKGGWVEIAGIIKPIESEMLFTVPEGNYTLSVSYRHFGGTKDVKVERGKETRVDVSDLKGDLLKTGKITFTFEPVEADPDIYIDGKKVDKTSPIELDYGVHTLDVKAEGYVNIHKYLSVGQPMANLAIILEEGEDKTASANSSDRNTGKKADNKDAIPSEALPETFKSGATGSSPSKTNEADNAAATDNTETVTTDVSQLYIDGPEGVEVYYDGAYKGIAPCHFKKNGGTHVITLMKNGYETKSYTLNLNSGTDNESYSFNELIEENDA